MCVIKCAHARTKLYKVATSQPPCTEIIIKKCSAIPVDHVDCAEVMVFDLPFKS